jgi:pimeloyl-ACP methyl ester carboxylesterase
MKATVPLRGEMVNIGGGRRLRVVAAGPRDAAAPLVVLEAGAFGFSADWDNVQAGLAEGGFASIAYDRAGLGASDPGPAPRDSEAVAADLEALLTVLAPDRPILLAGHSMAGLHTRLFTVRHPERVLGLTLVDATTPEAMESPMLRGFVEPFAGLSRLAAWGAEYGLLSPLSGALGDAIGLTGAAAEEKRGFFGHARHNKSAAAEAALWMKSSAEALAAGELDPKMPVAVVLAGAPEAPGAMSNYQTVPARKAERGMIDVVSGATHASLLGRRHAPRIVAAIEWVAAEAAGVKRARAS